jgi:hypothetical protein
MSVVIFNCFYLNFIMATTWVALPSAGGMGETASLNIREEADEARCLQRRK